MFKSYGSYFLLFFYLEPAEKTGAGAGQKKGLAPQHGLDSAKIGAIFLCHAFRYLAVLQECKVFANALPFFFPAISAKAPTIAETIE